MCVTISAPQQAFLLGQVEGQLGRRLGVGRVLEDEAHAVDRPSPAAVWSTISVGSRMPIVPRAGSLPSPVSTWPRGDARERHAVHEARAAPHRDAGEHVLAGRLLDEAAAARRCARRAATPRRGSTPAMPPKWSTWLCVKITATIGASPRCRRASASAAAAVSRAVSGSTTIQPVCAADQRHVRDVVAAHLVDAVGDLEEPVDAVELRLPPEARVHARRRVAA